MLIFNFFFLIHVYKTGIDMHSCFMTYQVPDVFVDNKVEDLKKRMESVGTTENQSNCDSREWRNSAYERLILNHYVLDMKKHIFTLITRQNQEF